MSYPRLIYSENNCYINHYIQVTCGWSGLKFFFLYNSLHCFLNNDRLKLEVLSLSGRLFHKYGNLLKKVPLTLIFNLLLEYDLNLLSEQKSK